mgnify:CR=1 FL=1
MDGAGAIWFVPLRSMKGPDEESLAILASVAFWARENAGTRRKVGNTRQSLLARAEDMLDARASRTWSTQAGDVHFLLMNDLANERLDRRIAERVNSRSIGTYMT